MNRTPPKRTASRSPENGRPHKRLATSSPEEGELDDETLNGVAHAIPLSRPVTPTKASSKFPPKVAFPFKKKNGSELSLPMKPVVSLQDDPVASAAVIYERSDEDERRIREKEMQRNSWVPHTDNRRSSYAADHWEPTRSYRNDDRRVTHDYHSSSHPRKDHRDRSRGHSSPSPARSSPSSTSTRRDKHRLPQRDRTPTYTPPRREYNIDRLRDNRERDDAWNRPRGGDRYDDNYYYRESGRPHDRGDAYYRPPSPRHDFHDRRDGHDRDSYHGSRRRDIDTYHPASPGPSVRTVSTATYPPQSPSLHGPQTPPLVNGPRTPPPPSETPPPPPPVADDTAILPSNTNFSITLPPKPPAPMNVHSPTPMPLPPVPSSARRDRETALLKETRKREPVRRTREEDYQAYGRFFGGCSAQEDYDVTTKLGEGTFGCVLSLLP